jgi:hypothetical protein
MRVLCINEKGWETKVKGIPGEPFVKVPGPLYGEVYEVVNEGVTGSQRYYELESWPDIKWCAECFIPISDIDETEFERYKQKQFVPWPADKAISHFKKYAQ